MDFHAFVFWGNGLYVSHLINKTTSKKCTRTKNIKKEG